MAQARPMYAPPETALIGPCRRGRCARERPSRGLLMGAGSKPPHAVLLPPSSQRAQLARLRGSVRALRCRGGTLSQRTRWERSAPHRVRRGVFVGAGGRIGPCSCRAPIRRARRARSRAWACWASASGRPPHREGRAGVGRERPRACALCPARGLRGRGWQPCPSCSSRALSACTTGTRRGSAARLEGFGCAARPAAVPRDPRAGS